VDVVIVEYDPAWPQRFEAEAARVAPIVGGDVHHIGSTAVPGLAAKPIIDLMALVGELAPAIGRLVERAGYEYPRLVGPQTERRAWLCHPSVEHRLHHLHLTDDAALFGRHLAFRDALRADPALCDEYAALKHELAERFRGDRDAYGDAKTEFIDRVIGPRAEARRPGDPAAS
jgi:GrpB-like predicted nucleotidyltransferase (UPF0157 family)